MVNIRSVIPAEAGNAYAYDNVGNRTSMMVTAGGVTRTHVYAYGNIYQVTGVDYPPELSYPSAGSGRALATDSTFNEACPERSERDAAGNRSSVIDGSGTCTYTTNNLNEYTAAGTSSYQYDASGNMTADGTYSFFYDPENRLIRTTKGSTGTRTLGQALDSGLTYTTGGADDWRVDYYEDYQGMCSARSGYIGDANESYLQTQVQGAGTVKFWWKVSSESGNDELEFWIDSTRQDHISGSVGWQEKTFTVSGTGTHTLKWRYVKDGTNHAGDDCGWVDWVQWSGPCPPVPEPASNNWNTLLYRAACPERSERDAAGRRIEKQYDWETITKYVYDGDHCIAEYDVSNILRRKYIYGPGVDQPISMIEAAGSYAGTYYYHFDALGSVVGLTNASGNTVEVYEYDVYGRLGASDASHPNRLLFTGREYDKETGLYYYRARYYNPQIGRFLQTDPMGYGDGMNWYRYCENNPMNGIDPSGLLSVEEYACMLWNDPCGYYKRKEALEKEKRLLEAQIWNWSLRKTRLEGEILRAEFALDWWGYQYTWDLVEYSCWWTFEKLTEGAEVAHQALGGVTGVSLPPVKISGSWRGRRIDIEVDVDEIITAAAATGAGFGQKIKEKAHEWKERVEHDMAQMNQAANKITALREQYCNTVTSLWNAQNRLKEVNDELSAMSRGEVRYVSQWAEKRRKGLIPD